MPFAACAWRECLELFYIGKACLLGQQASFYCSRGCSAAAYGMFAFMFMFYVAYDLAFTPLIVSYAIEILTYHLRDDLMSSGGGKAGVKP